MAHSEERFYFADPNSPIKSYPTEIIEQILADYYEGIKISEIRKKYPNIKSSGIYKQVPYVLTDELCEKCGNKIYTNKKKVGNKSFETHKLCISCGHNYNYDCPCTICATERKKEEEKKRSIAHDMWVQYCEENYNVSYTIEDLSMYDEIYLHILIRVFSDDECKFLNFSKLRASQYPVLFKNIQILIDRNIIILNEDNFLYPFGEYAFEENLSVNGNHNWILNLKNEDNDLMNLGCFLEYMYHKTYTEEEKYLLWKDVYQHELSSYFTNQSERFLSRTQIDSMIIDYITDLLIDKYPLSKAFAIIYFSVSSAMRYIQTYHTTETKVNSYLRNKITYFVEKRDVKTIKDFNRPSDIQNLVFNDFVLREVLNAQQNYFYLTTDKVLNLNDD